MGGWLKKQFHNATSGVANTLKDIPGSVKGFVNDPLQSIEKGVGGAIAPVLSNTLGISRQQLGGGALLLGAGLAGAGALGYGPMSGVFGTGTGAGAATLGGTTAAQQATAQAAASGAATDLTGYGAGGFGGATAGGGAGLGSSLLKGAGSAASGFGGFLKNYGPTLAQLGIGGAGLYEAYQQNKSANDALDAQQAMQDKSLALQQKQLDAATNLGQQSIDLSKQEYQNRLDIGNRIEANANLDPSYIQSEADRAGVTAEQQYANQLAQESRGLSRMGVDPSSGRYAGDMRSANLAAAAAKVGAMNNTRTGLTNYARSLKRQALSAELGINNPAIDTTGNQASRLQNQAAQTGNTGLAYSNIYGNQATQYSTNAQNALNSGLSAFTTIMDRNKAA